MKHTIHLIQSNAMGCALFLDDTLVNAVNRRDDGLRLEESAVNLANALGSSVQFINIPDDKLVASRTGFSWQSVFHKFREEGRIRPGGQMPNESLSYQLNINVSGDSEGDLVMAVNEISSKIDDGYTNGFDSNDTGAYQFDLQHKPEPALAPLKK